MTSKEKIKEILRWIQDEPCADWNLMRGLKQDLDELVAIAHKEGIDKLENKLLSHLDKE